MTFKSFETNRLMVKSTTTENIAFSIEIWYDEEMGKYLGDPPREKAADECKDLIETIEVYDGCYYFTAASKNSGKNIGTCGAVPSDDQTHWDISYTIHKDYWQQGYATEMIQGLIGFCRENGGQKITAHVAKENPGSNGVMRKLGFVVESEGSFKKRHTDIVYEKNIYRLDL